MKYRSASSPACTGKGDSSALTEAVDFGATADAWQLTEATALGETFSASALVESCPSLRPPIIDGLLREGEVMNVIASPKTGKSWLILGWARAISEGQTFLSLRTHQRRVLLLDNELHRETLARRIHKVCGRDDDMIAAMPAGLFVLPRRGMNNDLFHIADELIQELKARQIGVLILDALYRMFPTVAPFSENSNADMTSLYNELDRIATEANCAIIVVHHSSKGDQSQKAVTDGGSGAGAISRAADTHVFLRRHAEENCITLDAVVRSWPPFESIVLSNDAGLWQVEADLDPRQLAGTGEASQQVTPERLKSLLKPEHAELDVIRAWVEEVGYKGGRDRLKGLLDALVARGEAHASTGPRGVRRWGREPQPDDTAKGRVEALIAQGETDAEAIAEAVGCSKRFVFQMLKKYRCD